ncbi:MAG: M20/M25/M40 family metallo-hydrolase [Pirellulales bacterium]
MINRVAIDADRLLNTFLSILRINSYHPNEDPVIRALQPQLDRVGVELTVDEHRNVLGYWAGIGSLANRESILLCAHTDTVRPTDGLVPIMRDGAVHSDGSSVLGADDKAAVAAIVEALEAIADAGIPHPPAEILFTVGEDVGHIGSKAFDATLVRSRMAFVPDADGPVGGIMLQAPWSQTARIVFHGRAAHAGMEPETGRSAIAMAAAAITQMQLGRIDEETTANVGQISGGEASNVVPPRAELVWNARSLNEEKCERLCANILECCRQAAAAAEGTISVERMRSFAGFRFLPNDTIVCRAESAIKAAGFEPWHAATCGGSDASELNAKGLPTIVLSVGYQKIHTCQESMPLIELNRLARVCAALVLGE